MTLPRYRVEYEMYLTSHPHGDLVELKDVIKMIEDFKLTNKDFLNNDFDAGWNSCIDGMLKELKKETK